MSTMRFKRSAYELVVEREQINVTSNLPTPRESWAFVDRAGHAHHYDRGYPTLNYVVDERHWCDGSEGWSNHDPHWAVDASHYECRECGETIEPEMDPPGTPKWIAGALSATLIGPDSFGRVVTMWLTEDDARRLAEAGDGMDAQALRMVDEPGERLIRVEFSAP